MGLVKSFPTVPKPWLKVISKAAPTAMEFQLHTCDREELAIRRKASDCLACATRIDRRDRAVLPGHWAVAAALVSLIHGACEEVDNVSHQIGVRTMATIRVLPRKWRVLPLR